MFRADLVRKEDFMGEMARVWLEAWSFGETRRDETRKVFKYVKMMADPAEPLLKRARILGFTLWSIFRKLLVTEKNTRGAFKQKQCDEFVPWPCCIVYFSFSIVSKILIIYFIWEKCRIDRSIGRLEETVKKRSSIPCNYALSIVRKISFNYVPIKLVPSQFNNFNTVSSSK